MKRSIPTLSFWNASPQLAALLLAFLTLGGQSAAWAAAEHLVRPGDSLWGIANRYGVSQDAIRTANRMPNDQVVLGSTLTIPTKGSANKSPSRPTTHSSSPGVHIVRPGQTFSGIARSHGLSMASLQAANPGVNPEPLLVDTRLVIPGKGASTSKPMPPAPPAPHSSALDYPSSPGTGSTTTGSGTAYHTVRPGDTMTGLAVTYGVSSAAIQSANRISDPNLLTVGQRLTIPGTNTSHVASNDNMATTSYRPQPVAPPPPTAPSPPPSLPESAPEPKPLASVSPNAIKPPTSSDTKPKSTSFSDSHRAVLAYRLEKGDSLETVANLFGTTPDKLRDLNKLPPGAALGAGDELVVPAMASVSN